MFKYSRVALRQHIFEAHKGVTGIKIKVSPNEDGEFPCNHCGQLFEDSKILIQHIATKHKDKIDILVNKEVFQQKVQENMTPKKITKIPSNQKVSVLLRGHS